MFKAISLSYLCKVYCYMSWWCRFIFFYFLYFHNLWVKPLLSPFKLLYGCFISRIQAWKMVSLHLEYCFWWFGKVMFIEFATIHLHDDNDFQNHTFCTFCCLNTYKSCSFVFGLFMHLLVSIQCPWRKKTARQIEDATTISMKFMTCCWNLVMT